MDPSQNELIKSIDDTNKLVWNNRGVPVNGADLYKKCSEALVISKSINYQFGEAQCLLNLGMGSFILKHDSNLALSQLQEANLIFKDLKNEKWIANSYLTIGI